MQRIEILEAQVADLRSVIESMQEECEKFLESIQTRFNDFGNTIRILSSNDMLFSGRSGIRSLSSNASSSPHLITERKSSSTSGLDLHEYVNA